MHRGIEIILGLILASAAVAFAAAAIVGVWKSAWEREPFGVAVAAFIAAVAYVAGTLALRLLSGRERPEGGLFPWWLLYLGGGMASSVAAARRTIWGSDLAAETAAKEMFAEGRSRRSRKQRLKRR